MKNNVQTGKQIFEAMTDLNNECNKLMEVCKVVKERVGTGNIVYSILQSNLKKTQVELALIENQMYLSVDQ